MNAKHSDLDRILDTAKSFAKERDWQQFHSPKNLSMALSAESGELLEIFQWLSCKESAELSAEQRELVAQEVADIQLYLCLLADKLSINIPSAVEKKMKLNESRYPKEKSRGNAKKYTEL